MNVNSKVSLKMNTKWQMWTKQGFWLCQCCFCFKCHPQKAISILWFFLCPFASHCIDSQLSRSYAFFPFWLVTMSLGSQLQPVVPRDCYGDGRSVAAATHVFVEKTTANIMAIVSTTVKVYEKPIWPLKIERVEGNMCILCATRIYFSANVFSSSPFAPSLLPFSSLSFSAIQPQTPPWKNRMPLLTSPTLLLNYHTQVVCCLLCFVYFSFFPPLFLLFFLVFYNVAWFLLYLTY